MTNTRSVAIHEVVSLAEDELSERRALEYLYVEQRSALEDRFEQQGVTVFVADYVLGQAPGVGEFSFCVWTQGGSTLLPETEFVLVTGLGDTGEYWELLVPWDVAVRVTGEVCLVKEPNLVPIRWRAATWPCRLMLERMRVHAVGLDFAAVELLK